MVIDKELIDQHTADIEDLRKKVGAPVVMPEIKGDGLDMAQLMNVFACKSPPDSTIVRIEELEKQVADLAKRPVGTGEVGPALDADAMDKINDLLRRVKSLETRADKTDGRLDKDEASLADHERRIKALEAMDLSASPVAVSGEIDTAAILQQINILKAEVSSVRTESQAFQSKMVADLEGLRIELRGYTDNEVGGLKKSLTKKIDDVAEASKYELDRLRAEFETFKSKDFRDLEARVTALEKRM